MASNTPGYVITWDGGQPHNADTGWFVQATIDVQEPGDLPQLRVGSPRNFVSTPRYMGGGNVEASGTDNFIASLTHRPSGGGSISGYFNLKTYKATIIVGNGQSGGKLIYGPEPSIKGAGGSKAGGKKNLNAVSMYANAGGVKAEGVDAVVKTKTNKKPAINYAGGAKNKIPVKTIKKPGGAYAGGKNEQPASSAKIIIGAVKASGSCDRDKTWDI